MTRSWQNTQQIRFVEILFSIRWYVELVLHSQTLSLCSKSSMEYSEKEPALQCRRQYYAPYSSSLKPGSGATGSPGLGGIRTAGLYTSSVLLKREDTRLKTSARVRMGLSFAWKASLAIRILYFLPCNQLHVNHSPLRCLYKPERMVLRKSITITIIPS